MFGGDQQGGHRRGPPRNGAACRQDLDVLENRLDVDLVVAGLRLRGCDENIHAVAFLDELIHSRELGQMHRDRPHTGSNTRGHEGVFFGVDVFQQ